MTKLPVLSFYDDKNAQVSPFNDPLEDDRTVLIEGGLCFKLYSFTSFLANQRVQLDFYNEYVITRRAKEKNLRNIIHY